MGSISFGDWCFSLDDCVLPEKLLEEGLYEKKVFERIFGL